MLLHVSPQVISGQVGRHALEPPRTGTGAFLSPGPSHLWSVKVGRTLPSVTGRGTCLGCTAGLRSGQLTPPGPRSSFSLFRWCSPNSQGYELGATGILMCASPFPHTPTVGSSSSKPTRADSTVSPITSGIRWLQYRDVEACCKVLRMPEQVMTAWVSFGRELRRLRERRGLTLDQAAESTGYGASTISKYENAYRAPKRDFLNEAEALFGTNGDLLRRWTEAKRAEDDPDWHRKIVTAEEQAIGIKMWNPGLVPGILQTPEYARQIFRDGRPLDTTDEIERLVDLRVSRLDMLRQMTNPRMLVIVSEAVIRARVGSPAIMKGQLDHLLSLDATGVVRVLVLPEDAPYYGGAAGPFRLLEFRDRATLVQVEHTSGGELLTGDTVTRLSAVYGELQTWALPPVASREMILKAIGGLE